MDGQVLGDMTSLPANSMLETWENPVNLSRRINSENDDIAFSIDKTDGKSAFYTKKQKSGNGEMQLFKVVLKQDHGR